MIRGRNVGCGSRRCTTTELDMPQPTIIDYEIESSGRFNLRVPKALHRTLADSADDAGVSLNQYVVSLLSRGDSQARVEARLERLEAALGVERRTKGARVAEERADVRGTNARQEDAQRTPQEGDREAEQGEMTTAITNATLIDGTGADPVHERDGAHRGRADHGGRRGRQHPAGCGRHRRGRADGDAGDDRLPRAPVGAGDAPAGAAADAADAQRLLRDAERTADAGRRDHDGARCIGIAAGVQDGDRARADPGAADADLGAGAVADGRAR